MILAPDLFGQPVNVTPKKRTRNTTPHGYYNPPGTGPAGETCGSCAHHRALRYAKTYHKCARIEAKWTHGPGTDIRVRAPACKVWEKKNVIPQP